MTFGSDSADWEEFLNLTTNANASNSSAGPVCQYYGTHNVQVKIFLILGVGSAIAFVALIENIFLSYLLMSNSRFRSSQLFYLCILSFLDTFLAISYLALMSFMVLFDHLHSLRMYRVWMQYVRPMLSVSVIALTSQVYLILAMSFERYLQTLTHLQRIKKIVENHRWMITIFVFVFAAIIRGTKYWEISIAYKEECAGIFGEYDFGGALLLNNEVFHQVWTFWVRSTVHVLLPFPLLLYFNLAILCTMRKHYVSEKRSNTSSDEQMSSLSASKTRSSVRQATLMLISVVCMYLISNFLNFITTIWEFADRTTLWYDYFEFYDYSSDIISILTILSGALRLPVYCICNKYIRIECIRMLKSIRTTLCCVKELKFNSTVTDGTMISTYHDTSDARNLLSPMFQLRNNSLHRQNSTPMTEKSRLSSPPCDSIIEINFSDQKAGTSIVEYTHYQAINGALTQL